MRKKEGQSQMKSWNLTCHQLLPEAKHQHLHPPPPWQRFDAGRVLSWQWYLVVVFLVLDLVLMMTRMMIPMLHAMYWQENRIGALEYALWG